MGNYKNQNIITDINLDKIKHNAGVQESWLQPIAWDKLTVPFFLLKGTEFKVYLYLLQWAGKGSYEYSPANILKILDISEDTSRKIFKKLIQYGYLIHSKASYYKFDPCPDIALQAYYKKYVEKFGEKPV